MDGDFWVPFGFGQGEYVEKRSRFIGQVWRVEDEAEARQRLEETRRQFHDARHHCWCYRLRQGGERYGDDGEPQGTAGLPMLNVFQRGEITQVCCVVTRYFGGVLLGAGGLSRAYGKAARDALSAAGVSRVSRWTLWDLDCPYPLLERCKAELSAAGAVIEGADYGERVVLHAAFPTGGAEGFAPRLNEVSAGSLSLTSRGEEFRPGPREER